MIREQNAFLLEKTMRSRRHYWLKGYCEGNLEKDEVACKWLRRGNQPSSEKSSVVID